MTRLQSIAYRNAFALAIEQLPENQMAKDGDFLVGLSVNK